MKSIRSILRLKKDEATTFSQSAVYGNMDMFWRMTPVSVHILGRKRAHSQAG
jgi:hypothetical protein